MNDPRFKIAHKEAWIGVVLAIIHFLWWYGFAYGIGSNKVEQYTYILGYQHGFFIAVCLASSSLWC